jgi:F-type H+-transporting ATPase subunit b
VTRRAASRVALVAAVLAAAADAGAVVPGSALGEQGVKGVLFELLNLALLAGAILYFARQPVQAYFAERRRGIQHDLDSSAELLAQAERRYADWQRKLLELDRELEEIRTTARERAREERERILADAATAAERIRRDATAAVDQELRRARAKLREEAADLAIELAGRLLSANANAGDHARLVDEFITEVARAQAGGARPGAGS